MLTDDEITRYERQLPIDGWGIETQEKLKKARVFIAGTGGLGSPVLYYLAAAGVGNIKICDYDRIELSNLNRQILYSQKKLGSLKVDSAFNTIKNLNSNVDIIRIKDKLTKKDADRIIGNVEIILDCLDNFETRHILNTISVKRGIPIIHAGISEISGQVTFLSPPETPCLQCFIPGNIEERKEAVLGSCAGVIGSIQATEAIKFLAGIGDNLKNKLLIWNGLNMRFRIIELLKDPRCKACGV